MSGGAAPGRGGEKPQPLPLEGVVVLDLTHVLSGPFCTMMLGDLGADVIKVERLEGEETRRSAFSTNGYSLQFGLINRNKRSLALDLSTREGRAVVRRLASRADVLVENFRPGALDRLDLGYETLSAENPRLVYCSISGFGTEGSQAGRGGFDIVAQGESGLLSVTGTREGELVKLGVPICDLTAAADAALAITAALYRSRITGRGERIDVALLDAGMSLLVWEAAQLWSTGTVPEPMGTAHRNRAPYQAFEAADGAFIVGAGNQATWRDLCCAVGRPGLADDERFVDNPRRVENEQALIEELAPIFRTAGVDHWLNVLGAAGCPCGRIANVAEAFDSPVAEERGMRLTMEHPVTGEMPGIGFPYKLTSSPARVRRRPPLLGEHTAEILRDLAGLSDETLASLTERGIVRTGERIL